MSILNLKKKLDIAFDTMQDLYEIINELIPVVDDDHIYGTNQHAFHLMESIKDLLINTNSDVFYDILISNIRYDRPNHSVSSISVIADEFRIDMWGEYPTLTFDLFGNKIRINSNGIINTALLSYELPVDRCFKNWTEEDLVMLRLAL